MDIFSIIIALLVFGVLVLIHEAGHFLVARFFDTRIYEFAIGMGPTVAKIKKKGILYSIHALPVGGFVRFDAYPRPEYESEEERLADTKEYEESFDDERSLNNKPPFQKILILFAGSFMNLLMALLLFSGIFVYYGQPTNEIEMVQENMPAYEAGIESGDIITKIDGVETPTWNDITSAILNAKNDTISIEVNRNGNTENFQLEKVEVDGTIKVGIVPEMKHNILLGIKDGFNYTVAIGKEMVSMVGQLFTGESSVNEFTGPVGIVEIVGQAVSIGAIYVINLAALLSLNLGVLNLLPFPVLDGSKIIIAFVELLRKGKKLPQKIESAFHMSGAVILFGLMIYLTFKDVFRIFIK